MTSLMLPGGRALVVESTGDADAGVILDLFDVLARAGAPAFALMDEFDLKAEECWSLLELRGVELKFDKQWVRKEFALLQSFASMSTESMLRRQFDTNARWMRRVLRESGVSEERTSLTSYHSPTGK